MPDCLGTRREDFEAWVYPLKILRDFHLRFLVDGRVIPAEALARTLTVRPESSTILYTGDTFAVRETFFVPVHEPGAVIIIEVETAEPLDVQVVFERDFQLEWPAALGGTYSYWDPKISAFHFGEEQKKFVCFRRLTHRQRRPRRNTTPTIPARRKTRSIWASPAKVKRPRSW